MACFLASGLCGLLNAYCDFDWFHEFWLGVCCIYVNSCIVGEGVLSKMRFLHVGGQFDSSWIHLKNSKKLVLVLESNSFKIFTSRYKTICFIFTFQMDEFT